MVNYYVTIADKSQTAPGLRQQTGACFIAKGSTMVYSFMNPLSSTFESAVTELALREGHLLHHCTCLSPSAQQKRTRPPGSRMCLFATGSKLLKERDGESPKKWTPGCCQQHQTAPLWISKSKTGLTINKKKMTSFGTAGGVHVNMSIDPSRHLASGGFYLNYTHWTQV